MFAKLLSEVCVIPQNRGRFRILEKRFELGEVSFIVPREIVQLIDSKFIFRIIGAKC
jgi:hypothetical protein